MSQNHRAAGPDLVALGRIVRAQGLKGAVRVLPYGMPPAIGSQLAGKRVILRSSPPHRTMPATLAHQRWQKGLWIVQLTGLAARNDAEAVVGWDVCIAEEDRPPLPPDEFYCDQLVGLRVEDSKTGQTLGQVAAIMPAVTADLLEVERPEGKRFLIPLLRVFVNEVDLSRHVIRVDLPDGLTEITC